MEEMGGSSEPWAAEAPEEQQEAVKVEESRVAASVPVIQDILDWFQEMQEFYAGVDSLGITDTTSGEDAKVAVLLAKKMRGAFQSKSAEFNAQFARYLKEEPPK